MPTDNTTIFSQFLTALEVPHTRRYSDKRLRTMTFKSLFGLSRLLREYGIDNEAVRVDDKRAAIGMLPVPFLAQTRDSFVIVDVTSPDKVGYTAHGERSTMSLADFIDRWSGVALMAYPDARSGEPDYRAHLIEEIGNTAKGYILWACGLFLFLYLFISGGLYRNVSTVLVTAVYLAGLFMTYLLMLKKLNRGNHVADRVCGVLQDGGCDTVLEQKASTFFGIFGWSEVGFSYFTVSLLTLLVFPQYDGYLALINLCCLPFTLWSIWYQRFRAHAWCTLCVSVQCLLWLQFFCWLGGGFYHRLFPLHIQFFVLGATYVAALLLLNRLSPLATKGYDDLR